MTDLVDVLKRIVSLDPNKPTYEELSDLVLEVCAEKGLIPGLKPDEDDPAEVVARLLLAFNQGGDKCGLGYRQAVQLSVSYLELKKENHRIKLYNSLARPGGDPLREAALEYCKASASGRNANPEWRVFLDLWEKQV